MTENTTQTAADRETAARLDKIQKLLAKAEGASTEAEAAAFFGKAEELMARWAIDDAMLRSAGKKAADTIEQRTFPWLSAKQTWDSDMRLMHAIVRARGVKMLISPRARTMYLIGFTSDVDDCITMFTSLQTQSVRFYREAWRNLDKDEKAALGQYDKRVWTRSFRDGFADRVYVRLAEVQARTRDEARETHGSGMDLVLVDRRKQVEDFFDGIAKRKGRSTGGRTDDGARDAGRAAADRADMGQRRVGGRAALGR